MNNYSIAMDDEIGSEKTRSQRAVSEQNINFKAFSVESLSEYGKEFPVYFQLNLSRPRNNNKSYILNRSFALIPDTTKLLNPIDFKKLILAEFSLFYFYYYNKNYMIINNINYKNISYIKSEFIYSCYLFLESYSKICICNYMLIPSIYIERYNFLIEGKEFKKSITGEFSFKRIIPLSLNADNRFIMYGKAPVTILTGTSNAGKTTLIDFFRKSSTDLTDYSIDLFCDKSLEKTIKNYHPDEYSRIVENLEPKKMINFILGDNIKKIPNHIQEDLLLLRSIYGRGIPRAERSYFKSKLSRLPFKIWKESRNDSPVIMDFKFVNLSEMFWNFKAPITLLWVFCPLKVLSDRLTIRNIIAEKEEKLSNRRQRTAIWEYAELYRKKTFPDEATLEVLKRKDAIASFQEHYPDSNKQALEEFLYKLGFESSNTEQVEITFRHNPFLFIADKYLFIDTSLAETKYVPLCPLDSHQTNA